VAAANDLGNMAAKDSEGDNARTSLSIRKALLEFQHAIGAPGRCPFPVIVAVHGAVVGLGVDLICACDIRYAASDTSFAIKASTPTRNTKYTFLILLVGGRPRARAGPWNPILPPKDHWERFSSSGADTHWTYIFRSGG
jgi:hypothetical protein